MGHSWILSFFFSPFIFWFACRIKRVDLLFHLGSYGLCGYFPHHTFSSVISWRQSCRIPWKACIFFFKFKKKYRFSSLTSISPSMFFWLFHRNPCCSWIILLFFGLGHCFDWYLAQGFAFHFLCFTITILNKMYLLQSDYLFL